MNCFYWIPAENHHTSVCFNGDGFFIEDRSVVRVFCFLSFGDDIPAVLMKYFLKDDDVEVSFIELIDDCICP